MQWFTRGYHRGDLSEGRNGFLLDYVHTNDPQGPTEYEYELRCWGEFHFPATPSGEPATQVLRPSIPE